MAAMAPVGGRAAREQATAPLRGVTDPWMVTTHIGAGAAGVAPPNAQWFWEALFDRGEMTRKAAGAVRRDNASPVTLAWLVQNITRVAAKERRDRFEMVRFAQSVFGTLADGNDLDALFALGGYRRYHYHRSSQTYSDATWYASLDSYDRGTFNPGDDWSSGSGGYGEGEDGMDDGGFVDS